ncbi:MAG: nitrate/sulfonate/bicarbonate ABC transporter ATP-binding protein [Gemmatimonadaceae bacterium]
MTTFAASASSSLSAPGPDGALLAARDVSKIYGNDRAAALEHVSLELRAGEFVALLGPSGSGKSTLLRILAGLIAPSEGDVLVHGAPWTGPNSQVAIVFQSFALFPWLTVLQNVEMGLLAVDLPAAERRARAVKAIDLIGLDGFEEAFPKELSGGMKQRVGFARALVVQPEVLFLDEPFSALDVLTAEHLRTELKELWMDRSLPTKAVLMVTHNIEEAVTLADRVLVFGTNPGHIRVELPGVPLEQRKSRTPAQTRLVETIYRIMTNPDEDPSAFLERPKRRASRRPPKPRYPALPDVRLDELAGFVEFLSSIGGSADLHDLSRDLQLRHDDLLALVEATDLLDFAQVADRKVVLTPLGAEFSVADLDGEKALLRVAVVEHAPILRFVTRLLNEAPAHTLEAERLEAELRKAFGAEEAHRQFETTVDWGRYAELFNYDTTAGELRLDSEHQPGAEPLAPPDTSGA